jgi:predicted  nucleic acid-binding Zn-ribbon protein
MHPDLAKLITLQNQDNETRRLRDHIGELAAHLTTLETNAKTSQTKLGQVREAIAKEEALRRREESDISDLRQRLERAQKKIDLATTTAQVTALEHEITFAKGEISRLEDAELESMERSDTLETQRLQAEEAAADAAATLERERARVAEATAQDKSSLAELETQRLSLRSEILQSATGENSLSIYDRVARAKGTAVAQALDHKCTACQMLIRPQRWQDIIDNSPESPSAQTLMTCENCGRLLYYDPARDAPQRKSPQSTTASERNESIAAQIVRSTI